MSKQEIEIVIKATDLASGPMDKIGNRATALGNQIRKAGDIGDSGIIKTAGKRFGALGGLFGGADADDIGMIGKVGGAIAGVDLLTRALQGTADTIKDLRNGTMDLGEAIDKHLLSKLPLVGDLRKAAGSLDQQINEMTGARAGTSWFGEAIGSMTIGSKISSVWGDTKRTFGIDYDTVKAQADQIIAQTMAVRDQVNARLKARQDNEARFTDIIQSNDADIVRTLRDRDTRLRELASVASGGDLEYERKHAEARRVIIQQADDEIWRYSRENWRRISQEQVAATTDALATIRGIQRTTLDVQGEIEVGFMRSAGRELDADLRVIQDRYAQLRTQLDAEADRIRSGNMPEGERGIALQSIDNQRAALGIRERQEADERRQTAREQAETNIFRITRETLQLQADAGNRAAEQAVRRLEVTERIREREREIRAALAESELLPEARASLEAQLADLGNEAQTRLAMAEGQGRVTRPTTWRGSQMAVPALDGRYGGGAFVASHAVNVTSPSDRANQTTADNTTKTMQLMTTLIDVLRQKLPTVRRL